MREERRRVLKECVVFRSLGDIVSFESGGTPKKSNVSFWNGTIPWISAKTLVGEKIGSSAQNITKEGLDAGSRLAPKGSLLLLTRGSGLFKRIPLAITERPVAYNQDVKCLNTKDPEISNQYLFYALKAIEPDINAILETTGIGAGKLATDRLKMLRVPILGAKERGKAVAILDSFSRKIELNNRINDYLVA